MQRPILVFCQWLVIALPVLLFCGKVTSDIAMSVVAVLFLLHSARYGDFSWARQRWMQVAMLLTAYMCLRAVITADPTWFKFGYSFSWIRFPVAASALAYWILPDEKVRKRLFLSLTGALAFIMADTLFQFFHETDIFGHTTFIFQDLHRLTGPFSGPRPGITIVWLIFPVMLGWTKPQASPSAWWVLMSAVTVVTVFLTGERMALLLLLMGTGLCFLTMPRLRVLLCGGIIVALVMVGVLVQSRPVVLRRQVGQTHAAVAGFAQTSYGLTAQSSIAIFKANPLFGSGVRSFKTECPKPEYGPINDPQLLAARCPIHPHNLYLGWLSEYGLVGFVLYFTMVGFWVRDLFVKRNNWWHVPIMVGLVVTLVIRLWPLSAGTSHFSAWSAVPFWLCMGWMFVFLRDDRNQLKS